MPIYRPANAKKCSDLLPDESGADENNDGDHFFCVDTSHPADLKTAFQKAAIQLAGGPRLVQLYGRPDVDSVSPGGGSPAGGNTVTIGGKNFDGAFSVTFGPRKPGVDRVGGCDVDAQHDRRPGPAGDARPDRRHPGLHAGGTSKIETVDRIPLLAVAQTQPGEHLPAEAARANTRSTSTAAGPRQPSFVVRRPSPSRPLSRGRPAARGPARGAAAGRRCPAPARPPRARPSPPSGR